MVIFDPWCTDPLHDLDPAAHVVDGALWEALLEAEFDAGDPHAPDSAFGLLRGLRAMGCTLAPDDDGVVRLWPPDGETRETLVEWIGQDAGAVRAAVGRLGVLGLERAA